MELIRAGCPLLPTARNQSQAATRETARDRVRERDGDPPAGPGVGRREARAKTSPPPRRAGRVGEPTIPVPACRERTRDGGRRGPRGAIAYRYRVLYYRRSPKPVPAYAERKQS